MGLRYLLDTNILSEPIKPTPDWRVLEKLEVHAGEYVTASTVWHELVFGLEKMADSKRKQNLSAYLQGLSKGGLSTLNYDKNAATWLATQRAKLSKKGITISLTDGEIAAVAHTNHLTLVTRNTKDFTIFAGLTIENWFD